MLGVLKSQDNVIEVGLYPSLWVILISEFVHFSYALKTSVIFSVLFFRSFY